MSRAGLVALLALALGGPAETTGTVEGRLTVRRNGVGVEASGAVLYVIGFEEPPPRAVGEIRQRDKTFRPDLLPITAGQKVSFPNEDPFFHNVFSPSAAHRFDLGSFPRGETRSRRFPAVGVIDVFCNIHPQMAATILVLPNRRFARAEPDGRFRIAEVPAGRWTLYAFSRLATEAASAPIDVQPGRTVAVELTLDETSEPPAHLNKYGEKYRDPERYR